MPGAFPRRIQTSNAFHFSFKICKVIFDTILHLICGIGVCCRGQEVAQIYSYKKDIEEIGGCFITVSYQTHQN